MGSETLSYILGFCYVSTQILGIDFCIKQDKRGYALVKSEPKISELKSKEVFPTHTTLFLSQVSKAVHSTL